MTKLKIAVAVVLTVLSLFGCIYIASAFTSANAAMTPQPERVLTVLKSENLDFLVRRRQVTQVVLIQTADSSWMDWVPYVGPLRETMKEDGVLTANVRVYYGFDMKKLNDTSTSINTNTVSILLPDPEVLDFAVDMDSLKFTPLKTGIVTRIGNVFRDETLKDKLMKQIKNSVDEFVSTPGTMPSKDEMLSEMAGFERILSDGYGVTVEFR